MSDEARQMRQRIGAAIQADGPGFHDANAAVAATCTGWVVMAEWMDETGGKWLSKNSGDAGSERLTLWQENGMLHEALLGEWPTRDPDDED